MRNTNSMKLICVALALASCLSMVAAAEKSCKALVLEAGGDLGAYEAGVIDGLVKSYAALGKLEEVGWDVFSGTTNDLITSFFLPSFIHRRLPSPFLSAISLIPSFISPATYHVQPKFIPFLCSSLENNWGFNRALLRQNSNLSLQFSLLRSWLSR